MMQIKSKQSKAKQNKKKENKWIRFRDEIHERNRRKKNFFVF